VKKILFVLILIVSCSVHANDWEDARAAFEKKDYKTALAKFKSAAEGGNVDALFMVGALYQEGKGTTQNYKEAARWYGLGAAQGDADSMVNLGRLYSLGLGVTQNYKIANKWWKTAAEQGSAEGQAKIGWSYMLGKGNLENFVLAHMWLNLASAGDQKDAEKGRDMLSKQMTPQQIAEAQKLAKECLARNFKNCD
jgi:TPR repeat protein